MTGPASGGDGTVSWRQLLGRDGGRSRGARRRAGCARRRAARSATSSSTCSTHAVTERCVAHLDAMLARLRAGEPLQYVLGHWSFRRLDLLVDRRVLDPAAGDRARRGVAIDLARSLAVHSQGGPLPVADLGTGSGAIGLSLAAELPRGRRRGVAHRRVARRARRRPGEPGGLGHGRRGRAVRARLVVRGAARRRCAATWQWWSSNPPYIAPDDPDVDCRRARVGAGVGAVRRRRRARARAHHRRRSVAWLRPGGWLVLEIGTGQGPVVRPCCRCRARRGRGPPRPRRARPDRRRRRADRRARPVSRSGRRSGRAAISSSASTSWSAPATSRAALNSAARSTRAGDAAVDVVEQLVDRVLGERRRAPSPTPAPMYWSNENVSVSQPESSLMWRISSSSSSLMWRSAIMTSSSSSTAASCSRSAVACTDTWLYRSFRRWFMVAAT